MAFGFRRRKRRSAPGTATSQMRTALHLVLAGDLPAAEGALAEAARLDSSSSDVYMALANLYRARGEVGRAIQVHQNLLLQHDLSEQMRFEALLGLALDFRSGGFLKRAAASFGELLEVDPNNLQALRELERIHVETGAWEEALQIRKRIGRRDKRTPATLAHLWVGIGREKVQQGEESEARKAFKRSLGQDKSCAEAYVELGDQRMRENKPAKAIGFWKRTLSMHPMIGMILYPRLWDAFGSAGDLAGLEKLLLEQRKAVPDDREVVVWLARCMIEQKRSDDAIALLRGEIESRQDALAASAELGRVLLAEQREGEALKAFEELLDRMPIDRRKLQCFNCGTQDTELHWRCPQCGEWDSFV
ncbi:MAG: tetratricopeptide repeat protein [bacterium]|nr:tetratricopeptide repeat protein [bacterium]